MKTFLVPTDFSSPAMNAASYALQLAKYLEANLLLCNVFYLPTPIPTPNYVSLPQYDYETLKEESTRALEAVAKELRIKDHSLSTLESFHPTISCVSETGGVVDMLTEIAAQKKIKMAVLGMTGASALSRFFLGSISRSMIDRAGFPLLLVPATFSFKKIRKIAFASTLEQEDLEVVHSLAGLARHFNADLLIAHVATGNKAEEDEKEARNFLNEVTCKINYDKIYLRYINDKDVEQGISWLAGHGHIDLLVMVHHPKRLFDRLFTGSHTHTEANQLQVPLLILPAGIHPLF